MKNKYITKQKRRNLYIIINTDQLKTWNISLNNVKYFAHLQSPKLLWLHFKLQVHILWIFCHWELLIDYSLQDFSVMWIIFLIRKYVLGYQKKNNLFLFPWANMIKVDREDSQKSRKRTRKKCLCSAQLWL